MKIQNPYIYIVLGALSLLLFVVSINQGMFWDNVLFASKMGNHLFENGFLALSMPDTFDPGHPPFLAFMLAAIWKILGHKLWVSHLLMLPFVLGLLVQLYKFISHYVKDFKYQIAALALIIADPTLVAQLVLVNPEVIQLFFFFMAINALLNKQRILQTISLALLGIVTFRGMMLCAGIFLFELFNHLLINRLKLKAFFTRDVILTYLIGSIPALVYVIWRLSTKGWLQTHPGSPWESLWHFASVKIFAFNIFTLARWYADFGRVFVLGFIFLIILKKTALLNDLKIKQLLLLTVSSVIIIALVSLLSTNSFAHRYFIASFLTLILIAFKFLENIKKYQKLIYFMLLIGLITGNFWIYPQKVAQGWDASLAHIPYFNLRNEAIQYMNKQGVAVEKTASFFPNECSIDDVDLSGDKRSFSSFDGFNKYVFYSNVYNLTDQEFELIEKNYTAIKTFSSSRIYITLYQIKQ